MRKIAILILSSLFSAILYAQIAPDKYFIGFTDKNNSPYSIDRPLEFLSQRAVDKRQRLMIMLEETDLPVNETYVETIANLGVTVLNRSKWMNGITIYTTNHAILDSIAGLPFVLNVVRNHDLLSPEISGSRRENKFESEEKSMTAVGDPFKAISSFAGSGYNYGQSYTQIHMVNGDLLHQMGFRGEGMEIAILDAGFFQVNTLPAFDSLWENNQILGTRDFVIPGNDVFQEHPHGMEVLSVMGGNLPGQLVGTAPKAGFWLLRSEDNNSETLIEEYNWVSAAEFADSVGADVINSSLGYTTFNDPSQDHTCADMDGNTTVVTRGANTAGSKGMIVVNSAGNSGGSSWKCVGAPADGNSVLGIAAVDSLGLYASFSSTGEVNTRVKPNIAAMGEQTVVSSTSGSIMRANGTSFSSPVIAGMVTCLWQASPTTNNYTIMRSLEVSSSLFTSPDSLLGYGIPDFNKALNIMSNNNINSTVSLNVFPNPFTDGFTLSLTSEKSQQLNLLLVDQLGRTLFSLSGYQCRAGGNQIKVSNVASIKPGYYFLKLQNENSCYLIKIAKQ